MPWAQPLGYGGAKLGRVCRIAKYRLYVPVNAKEPIEFDHSIRFGYRGL
jgi:hypothetical protein